MVFALSLLPIIGLAGGAVDLRRIQTSRSELQDLADQAALNTAKGGPENPDRADLSLVLDTARQGPVVNVDGSGQWIGPGDFEVTITAQTETAFLQALPGAEDAVNIRVVSVARVAEPELVYKPPRVASLDPEAADYNRISAYCFDPEKASDAEGGRSQLTDIADNAGTAYSFEMPKCESGTFLSYKLLNVRNARKTPSRWDDPKATGRYEYFTDTTITAGVENYQLDGVKILENVVCDTMADCQGVSKGGKLPEGKNRTPKNDTSACVPGKYMYYGWEDRPPGRGWTDTDYDDIRVIIDCPVPELKGERRVRLVR